MMLLVLFGGGVFAQEPLSRIQDEAVSTKDEKRPRPYHFGSQGPNDVFSNHTSHSNRMVPVYTFGRKIDLRAITGANSSYRVEQKVRNLYLGHLPPHTVNPQAEYGDQSELYRVQKEAVDRGVKHLFIVWFDGLDWPSTQAAAIAKTGQIYTEGKGSGLNFQDESAEGSAQFGFVVTSPTHNDPPDELINLDTQSIGDLSKLLRGGYDARFAGATPWAPGPLLTQAPGYLRGQSATRTEKEAIEAAGGVVHTYTDSAPSAAEFASGVKQYNGSINVAADGRVVPTLFNQLQADGWRVGTVTSVPFDHASPAGMYAHNVSRDDYQDLAREMLGLPSVIQTTGKGPELPGLDVVIGAGWGNAGRESDYKKQGSNAVPGNMFVALTDLEKVDAANGGKYVVVQRTKGAKGTDALAAAASRAASESKRLFGFYGLPVSSHIPYRTADGDFRPVRGVRGVAEKYTPADLEENPRLVDMTRAALTVLASKPDQPFALFVEAGDVDFALHDNNLDNAAGAVYDGEDAIRAIFDWIRQNSNWDDSAVIVTADHGHYLVLDDLKAIAGSAGKN